MTPGLWQALRVLVSSSLCLLLLACSNSAPSLEATTQSVASTPAVEFTGGDYRLGAGDKIRIIVFGEQDLSGEFVVGDSGKVDLPLIGGVGANGATVSEFQDRVVSQLRNGYLNDPKVSVEVLNYRPFFITGEVKAAASIPIRQVSRCRMP